MVGVGGPVEIRSMTAGAGIRGVVVVAVVAGGTITGDRQVRSVQDPEVVVIRELGRTPTGLGGMAGGTIRREVEGLVVRIGCNVPVGHVAGVTIRGCPSIPGGMALDAIGGGMGPGQREAGVAVVKGIIGVAGRMAGEAGITVVVVTRYADMVIIRFGIGMASRAGEFGIIGRVGMTVRTLVPLTQMLAAVNGEILSVMVECGRRPG